MPWNSFRRPCFQPACQFTYSFAALMKSDKTNVSVSSIRFKLLTIFPAIVITIL